MELEVMVSEQTKAAYSESLELVGRLSLMSVEERESEYEKYQWMFPKSKRLINLDDQLGTRKDYKVKFREWFFVVCGYMFCPSHLGQCCYSTFQDRVLSSCGKKNTSDRYSQKVILALGMLGYLTKIKKNYSNCSVGNRHGIIFEVDLIKLNHWDKELNLKEGINREDVNLDDCADWRWKDQYQTIMDVKANQVILDKVKKLYYEDIPQYLKEHNMELRRTKTVCACESLISIANQSSYDIIAKHKIDDYGGRFYTPMTNLPKDIRHLCITLDGESIAEVDVSSAQPTFLGLYFKEKCNVNTEWLEHCIRGDFYEWMKKICKTKIEREKVKEHIMHYLYSYDNEYAEIQHTKEHKKGYWRFERLLNEYLKENEPFIFDEIQNHKKNAEKDEKKNKMRNSLSRDLVKMEVEYIKYCISKLPPNFKFYTIHDCICCKQSDAEYVKKIMEESSRELYNLTINLKIENGESMEVA